MECTFIIIYTQCCLLPLLISYMDNYACTPDLGMPSCLFDLSFYSFLTAPITIFAESCNQENGYASIQRISCRIKCFNTCSSLEPGKVLSFPATVHLLSKRLTWILCSFLIFGEQTYPLDNTQCKWERFLEMFISVLHAGEMMLTTLQLSNFSYEFNIFPKWSINCPLVKVYVVWFCDRLSVQRYPCELQNCRLIYIISIS